MNNTIQEKPYISQNLMSVKAKRSVPKIKAVPSYTEQVCFAGKTNNFGKHCWLKLKNLSDSMKEITEFTNALIAAVGTGIIAPFIILCSPGKGDKEDKDKKFFQAIRQPLSAFLALGFQVPATFAVNTGINSLAYQDETFVMKNKTINKYVHKFFDDEVLGKLIPDKNYIKKRSSTRVAAKELEATFDKADSSLRNELIEKIRKDYRNARLELSDKALEKEIKSRKKKFLLDKAVEKKHNEYIKAKCDELANKGLTIEDKNLVTEKLKLQMENQEEKALEQMEKNAKLSIFDRAARLMGFETKNVKKLKDAQDEYKVEKGIEFLKENEPEIFSKAELKLKKFIEARNDKAQKRFSNKKFWLSLVVNLFMVTASCYALNWAHPRLKELIDKHDKNQGDQKANLDKKVEVAA